MSKEKDLFEEIWEKEIVKNLDHLAPERKKAERRFLGGVGLGFMILLLFWTIIGVISGNEVWSSLFGTISLLVWVVFLLGLVILSVYFSLLIKNNKNNYSIGYKERVFNIIFGYTKFNWKFLRYSSPPDKFFIKEDNPEGNLEEEFKESNLYSGYQDVVSDDVIATKYNDVDLTASEIVATYTVQDKNGSHKNIVFEGFFIEIKLDKPFTGETYVMTEKDRSYFTGGHSMNIDRENIREATLEWNEFEEFLVVKTDNQIEAREIFAPDFMAVIYNWWIEHKRNIRFVFKGSKIYISIPSKVNFEPFLFGSKDREKMIIKEHLELLWFIEKLTEILIYHSRHKVEKVGPNLATL